MLPPKSLRIIWVVVAIFVTFILVSHVYTGDDQPYTLEKVDLWQPATGMRPQYHVLADAHNLQSADAFLPHFKAVMELPGYTVQKARRTCPLKHGEKVNFQWEENGPGKDWINHDAPNSEVESRRQEWQSFVSSGMIPYSKVKRKFSGRGLVIVAGNQDTLKGVEVILRSLIRLGSRIAVELHYWGDELAVPESELQRSIRDTQHRSSQKRRRVHQLPIQDGRAGQLTVCRAYSSRLGQHPSHRPGSFIRLPDVSRVRDCFLAGHSPDKASEPGLGHLQHPCKQ